MSNSDDPIRSVASKPRAHSSPGSTWMGAPPLPRRAVNSIAAFALDAFDEDEEDENGEAC